MLDEWWNYSDECKNELNFWACWLRASFPGNCEQVIRFYFRWSKRVVTILFCSACIIFCLRVFHSSLFNNSGVEWSIWNPISSDGNLWKIPTWKRCLKDSRLSTRNWWVNEWLKINLIQATQATALVICCQVFSRTVSYCKWEMTLTQNLIKLWHALQISIWKK